MKKVQVLLSTYNGEKYLEIQLKSILTQEGIEKLKILIRDDGSTDKTLEILERYKMLNENIEIIYGENKGVIKSFLELIQNADESFDYFSFCDQDDFWEPKKLFMGINKLSFENKKNPLLYCSNLNVTDEKLNIKKQQYAQKILINYKNSLFKNYNTGCTSIINKALLKKIKIKKDLEDNIIMHDWWIYIIANYFGKVVYDENSYIKYRQHSSNCVGSSLTYLSKIKSRFKMLEKRKNKNFYKRNMLFYSLYKEELSEEQNIFIQKILTNTLKTRFEIIFKEFGIRRENKMDTILMKILYLFNRY